MRLALDQRLGKVAQDGSDADECAERDSEIPGNAQRNAKDDGRSSSQDKAAKKAFPRFAGTDMRRELVSTDETPGKKGSRVRTPDAEEDNQHPPEATRQHPPGSMRERAAWLKASQEEEEAQRPAEIDGNGNGERPVNQRTIVLFASEQDGEGDEQGRAQAGLQQEEPPVGKHGGKQEEETQAQAHPHYGVVADMQQHPVKLVDAEQCDQYQQGKYPPAAEPGQNDDDGNADNSGKPPLYKRAWLLLARAAGLFWCVLLRILFFCASHAACSPCADPENSVGPN